MDGMLHELGSGPRTVRAAELGAAKPQHRVEEQSSRQLTADGGAERMHILQGRLARARDNRRGMLGRELHQRGEQISSRHGFLHGAKDWSEHKRPCLQLASDGPREGNRRGFVGTPDIG